MALDKYDFQNITKYMEEVKKKIPNYDYVVFASNRTADLFSTYERINNCPKFLNVVNYHRIDVIGKDFKDKKVLLVIDVTLTTSTITRVYKRIEKYSPKVLEAFALFNTIKKPDYFYFMTGKSISRIKYCGLNEVCEFSNKVNQYIHFNKQPANSFRYAFEVPSYCVSDTDKLKEESIDAKKAIMHSNEYPYGEEPVIYAYTKVKEYPFVKYAYFKVYPRNKDSKVILPYIILEDFYIKDLKNIWDSIWKNDQTLDSISHIKTHKDIYKVLTQIVAYMFLKDVYGDVKFTYQETERTFGENFDIFLSEKLRENALEIIKENYCRVHVTYKEGRMMNCIEDEIAKEEVTEANLIDTIYMYFSAVLFEQDADFNDIQKDICEYYSITASIAEKQRYRLEPVSIEKLISAFPKELQNDAFVTMIYLEDCYMIETTLVENESTIYSAIRLK